MSWKGHLDKLGVGGSFVAASVLNVVLRRRCAPGCEV